MLWIDEVPVVGHAVLLYTKPNGEFGWTKTIRNGVTVEGCNWLLETVFRGGPPAAIIYSGLISQASYSTTSANDTHASHSGWTEWSSLTLSTRPQWTPAAPVGGLMGTAVAAHYSFTSDGFIRGAFLSTIPTVGSTASGILYNTAIAVAPLEVDNGGTLDVSYSVRLGE